MATLVKSHCGRDKCMKLLPTSHLEAKNPTIFEAESLMNILKIMRSLSS